jgi:hypothetical protein
MSAVRPPVKFWTFTVLAGAALLVYLFATAPEALTSERSEKHTMSTEEAMTILAQENDFTRTLFTKEIVGKGKAQGLKFDEAWADANVIAGPLPALFLRGVSDELSMSDLPIQLYLGSDFPIESSNKFKDLQLEKFKAMRSTLEPQHFIDPDTGEHVSMFPDFASAPACVSCHNEHIKTTKSDWVLGDLMGATTWSYPEDSVTTDEFMAMVLEYRKGVESVWGQYLKELEELGDDQRPEIGKNWPSNGLYIPDHAALRDTIDKLANGPIFMALMDKAAL